MGKKIIFRIILGTLASVAIMAAGFYFFIFAEAIRLYQVNLLKWIPILLCFMALYTSGRINKDTPVKYLPFLLIPFIIFDLFNFFYFPFILVLAVIGILALLISRQEANKRVRAFSGMSVAGIFIYYLLAQPIILEHDGFGRNLEGELVNATVLWNPSEEGFQPLPPHLLVDENDNEFNLQNVTGKTHFIAFWATWCAPCLEEKPQLDSLKQAYQGKVNFIDLSVDEDKDKWLAFLEKHEPAGLQIITNNVNKTRRELNIGSLPLHFLVNANGEYQPFTSLTQAGKMLETGIE